MNSISATPALVGSQRDGGGRLIALVFDSAPPLAAPIVNLRLIAVDSSDNALRAVVHAASQAALMSAGGLHLVHVQPWLSKEAAETELAQRGLDATARARDTLDASGLPWRLHLVMGEPAEGILDLATQLHASEVVMGCRGLGNLEGVLLGSVSHKVMQLSRIPVLVVP